jgi:peptidyl-prolyl cis-trans isomerase D
MVKVTSDEIRSYYDKHKDQFKRGDSRDIEYITFEIAPSEEDIKETETWLSMRRRKLQLQATEVIQ